MSELLPADSLGMSITALLDAVNAELFPNGARAELALGARELRVSFAYAREPDAEQLVHWFLGQLNRYEWPGVERLILEGRFANGLDYHWRTAIDYPYVASSLRLPKRVPQKNDAWKSVVAGAALAAAVVAIGYGAY